MINFSPTWQYVNTTDIQPSSTAITHLYGNTQGFSLSVGGIAAATGQLDVIVGSSSTIGQIIKAAASQSSDLLQIQDSSANVLTKIQADGTMSVLFNNATVTNTVFIALGGGVLTGAAATPTFVAGTGEFAQTSSPFLGLPPFFFKFQLTTRCKTNPITMVEPAAFWAGHNNIADGVVWTGADIYGSFYDAPAFNIANGGSFSGMFHNSFTSGLTVGSGATLSTRRGINITDASGAGTLTNQYGIFVADLAKGATLNIPIYVKGTTGKSRHQPKISFGTDTDPTLNVEVKSGAYGGNMDTMTYASTITLTTTNGNVHKTTTVNATGNATINASDGGVAGQHMWILLVNDATSGKTITFGTNFKSTGTQAIGGASKSATTHWISDGTNWYEVSRTNNIT